MLQLHLCPEALILLYATVSFLSVYFSIEAKLSLFHQMGINCSAPNSSSDITIGLLLCVGYYDINCPCFCFCWYKDACMSWSIVDVFGKKNEFVGYERRQLPIKL